MVSPQLHCPSADPSRCTDPDPSRNSLPVYFNPAVDSSVQPTSLTLIIAPSAIVAQWHSEIAKHAPSLRVLRYENTKAIKETWTPAYIAQRYDIILTTFDVLRREVVLARKPHERALRSGREGRHRYRRCAVFPNSARTVSEHSHSGPCSCKSTSCAW